MSDLKRGDVVVLKSGGPKMTVEQVDAPTPEKRFVWVKTVWFVNDATVRGDFLLETLEVPKSPAGVRQPSLERDD